jgi:phosphate transport system substrate-binding protein
MNEQTARAIPTALTHSARPTGLIAFAISGVVAVAAAFWAVGYDGAPRRRAAVTAAPLPVAAGTIINGAGSSFVEPFAARLIGEYARFRPHVAIQYAAVGSGEGVRRFAAMETDFGATDAPMSDDEIARAAGGDVIHVPVTLGAVVPVYNLPGASGEPLVFSGPVLAEIFRGAITRWNDPAIAALNPAAVLPDEPITIVHRADGSGTTHVFTDYLSKVSPAFARNPGRGTAVTWPAPARLPAIGNDSVAGVVATTPRTIGYVELSHALRGGMTYGAVVNRAGRAVHATLDGVTAAAAATEPPADLRMSITDAVGPDAYPISAFSYVLVYKRTARAAKAQQFQAFLNWAVTDGQSFATGLGYAPLPPRVVDRALHAIASIEARSTTVATARGGD